MLQQKKVLVVDDDRGSREAVAKALRRTGYEVIAIDKGREAIELLTEDGINAMVVDLKMPDVDGMEILKAARERDSEIVAIMITGYGSVETAVEAMKIGAYDYLNKPINIDELRALLEKGLEKQRLALENEELRKRLDKKYGFENLIGNTEDMHRIYHKITQIAPTRATILIQGESGTGKDLIARAIHQNSPRKDKPFVTLSCAALAEGVLESELFGHERGAFTGAVGRRIGKFELADEGTLFLDEIGDISPAIQVKLLRVLETRELERVGGNKPVKVDVRLISATNADLEGAIANKTFREDLYYRLKVITINLPPLRERKEDIPLFINAFIKEFNKENNKNMTGITKEALDILMRYNWPGNVRELKNCIEGIVVMATTDIITADDIPVNIRESESVPKRIDLPIGITMKEAEREIIKRTLEKVDGDRSKAARILGIDVNTLKLKESGADIKHIALPKGITMREAEREIIKRTLESLGGNRTKTAEVLEIGLRTLQRKIKAYDLS